MSETSLTSVLGFPDSPDIPSPSPCSSHQSEQENNSLITSSHFLPPKYKNQLTLQLKQIAVWGQQETCALFLTITATAAVPDLCQRSTEAGAAARAGLNGAGIAASQCWAECGWNCCGAGWNGAGIAA